MRRYPDRRSGRTFFKWLGRFLIAGAVLCSIAIGAIVGAIVVYSGQLPSVDELSNYSPALVTKFFSSDGQMIAQFGTQKRLYVTLDQIAECFKKAIISVEDRNFYKHGGVDLYGVARALWKDITTGELAQGASTITQQLTRDMFLTREKKWARKAKEALLALRIERRYSKEEILEIYLNQIFFGANAYGIEAAAQVYFHKPASDLNLAEAAMLAGIPQSPTRLSPLKNLDLARVRMAVVLRSMVNVGAITREEEQKALQAPLEFSREGLYKNDAPYFADYVRSLLEKKYSQDTVWRGGMNVSTTLDYDMQIIAERVLTEELAALNAKADERASEDEEAAPAPHPMIQAGLIAIAPSSGAIVAMAGGTDYANNQWNRAVQANRQPGSAFKPLLFATAFNRDYTPSFVIVDEPITLDTRNPNGPWIPKNYENKYYGPTILGEALVRSQNVVAVKLLREVGLDPVIETASRLLGVGAYRFQYQKNLTMALGSVEVTPLEIASAFSCFANQGIRVEPNAIEEIRSSDGDLLDAPKARADVVLSPEVAYVITDVMKKVLTHGTGRPAALEGRPAAGKTGTTDECVSAWFVGYTPELCCAVYVAYDDKMSLGHGMTGGRIAGPIWARFMKEALADVPASDFPVPANITSVTIDWDSGLLATEGCGNHTYRQAYVTGTEPKAECQCGDFFAEPQL